MAVQGEYAVLYGLRGTGLEQLSFLSEFPEKEIWFVLASLEALAVHENRANAGKILNSKDA